MKSLFVAALSLFLVGIVPNAGRAAGDGSQRCVPGLDQEFRRLHSSESLNLCEVYGQRPMLIVNTASHCGFTPQFDALETVHREYVDKGLVVIGFPSDNFHQEAADESKTAEICYINFGVSFTMVAPTRVKGPNAHPLFRHLAAETAAPRWNFTKYLVSRDGDITHRFGSSVEPDSKPVTDAIESLL